MGWVKRHGLLFICGIALSMAATGGFLYLDAQGRQSPMLTRKIRTPLELDTAPVIAESDSSLRAASPEPPPPPSAAIDPIILESPAFVSTVSRDCPLASL
ncbi:hypothetical protein FACS1894186_7830 [Alphaproteobacteria bacterium]|nr:hypothetical protein FACS1894186_7830 [Alphaproteobacteria bacterium]